MNLLENNLKIYCWFNMKRLFCTNCVQLKHTNYYKEEYRQIETNHEFNTLFRAGIIDMGNLEFKILFIIKDKPCF